MSECRLKVHQFSKSVSETVIHFHVLRLKDSFFVWIGTKPELKQLAIGMLWTTQDVKNHHPIHPRPSVTATASTALMGDFSDTTSQSLAARLAKRTGKQVVVSCNLSGNEEMKLAAEQALHDEMDNHPAKF